MKKVVYIIIGLLLILSIWFLVRGSGNREELGERVPDMGRNHIAMGAEHESYNSNPPSSGPHTARDVDWGVYGEELIDEMVVHNLEHGGVWITYRDQSDAELKGQLETLARSYRTKVVLSPRSRNDSRIAVVSWGRIMKLESFDEQKIRSFIEQYKNKGPEYIPD